VVVRPAASLAEDAKGSYGTGWIDWGGSSSSDQVVGMLAKRVRVISSLGTLDGVSSTSVVAEGLSDKDKETCAVLCIAAAMLTVNGPGLYNATTDG